MGGRLDSAENSAALMKQLFRQCGVAAGLTYTRYACALAPGLDGKIIGAQERAGALIQKKLSPRKVETARILMGKIIGAQAAAVQRLIFQAATGFA